jgi:adenylate cyclase
MGADLDPFCRMQVPRSGAAGHLRHGEHDFWFCSLECAATFAAHPERYSQST